MDRLAQLGSITCEITALKNDIGIGKQKYKILVFSFYIKTNYPR